MEVAGVEADRVRALHADAVLIRGVEQLPGGLS